jgi:LuxR family maltose regulon positive regulatory protein
MWDKADDLSLAYVTLVRIHMAQANRRDAMEAIEKATQFIQTRAVFFEARKAVELAQVKLWLALGDLYSASRWAGSLQERFGSDDSFGFGNEVTHIAQARVLIAQNKSGQAIRLLSCLEESAHSGGRQGRLIEIMILKALALQAAGDTTQAVVALAKSLTLAEPEGYARIFLDEGEPMLELLEKLRTSKLTPQVKDYVSRLLEAFTSEASRSAPNREREGSWKH